MDCQAFRVLIVDDNPADGRLAELVLKSELPGINIDEASTAVDFAERLVDGRFDVAVVERHLSWSDGRDVIRALRRTHPACPVILFTSDYAPLDFAWDADEKPSEYLVKEWAGYLQLSVAVRRQIERKQIHAYGDDGLAARLPLGALALSGEGRILSANPAAQRVLALAAGELKGRALIDCLAGDPERQAVRQALADRGRLDGLGSRLVRDGGQGPAIRLWLWPVAGQGDAAFEGLIEDVSGLQAEADRRSQELQALQAKSVELERFATILAHELQSPLGRISRYTQLLIDRHGSALWRDLHQILDETRRAQDTVDDLLAYSQVGAMGKALELVDFGAAVDAAAAHLEDAFTQSGGKLTRDPLPTLPAHRGAIERLFENLINNALKYHGPRLPEVRVSASEHAGVWTFALSDNGIGIPAADRERVFDLFTRLESTKDLPGTGIGLAICKGIVENHGGRIWVDSRQDQGSTFYFTIPSAAATDRQGDSRPV
jgi:signal transduction histidine kinase